MNKKELLEIFEDTRNISNTYLWDGTNRSIHISEVIEPEDLMDLNIGNVEAKPILFTHDGYVNVAHNLSKQYDDSVVIFNSCNLDNVGSIRYGTQENILCVCTNLYEILSDDIIQRAFYQPSKSFPGFGTDKIAYCKDVIIIRDDITYKQTSYRLVDVLCCAPPTVKMQKFIEGPLVYNRLYYGLSSAILNKDKILVIGPWGCEYDTQSIDNIAEQFALCFNHLRQCFDTVIFAFNHEDDKYDKFIKVFKKYYKGTVNEE